MLQMSKSIQNNVSIASSEALEIIREEKASPPTTSSSVCMVSSNLAAEELQKDLLKCICKQYDEASKIKIAPSHVEEILKEKEIELREEYEKILEREKEHIKERFDFILSNEQTRASYMLREAHRERQEKIHALQTQLQCKNLAALMYVMCTERRRSKLEKLKIVEDYTNYINILHGILTQGQELILHLSRGYKTAARVDHEWREKMKKVVSEFMAFIYHFAGGDPETNQYLIDLPKLLTTKTPTEVNIEEDPCVCDDEEEDESLEDKPAQPKEWWEHMNAENRPFVMYGDMADFNPDRRREVLKQIKEAQRIRPEKTAPKEWKELSFKDMFFKSKCVNLDKIKDVYPDKLPVAIKWECTHSPPDGDWRTNSKMRNSIKPQDEKPPENVILNIGKKRASVFVELETDEEFEGRTPPLSAPTSTHEDKTSKHDDKINAESMSMLGSIHNDSLQMIQRRNPEQDHKINYERVCPMEKCQRMQVDSFMRTLPPYMRANPFTHFEQTFEQYETCTPEQLKKLQERIEHKMHKKSLESEVESGLQSPLSEWMSTGVAVQTSDLNLLPPCTCQPEPGAPETPVSSNFVFNLAKLESVKLAMDAIHRECLFDDRIEFDRFKLIGQEMDSRKIKQEQQEKVFKQSRYQEISEILEKHPSLLHIFQANAR